MRSLLILLLLATPAHASRAIINGAHDTTGLAPMNYDTLHFHDQGYAGQAGLWYSVLP